MGIAAISIVALHVTTAKHALARELVDELASVQRLRLQAEKIVAATRGYLLTGEHSYQLGADAAQVELDAQLDELRARQLDVESDREAAAVSRSARAYALASTRAASQRSSATLDKLVTYFDDTLQSQRTSFESSVDTFASHQRASFDVALDHARSVARTAQLAVVIAAVAAMAIAISLATAVIRRLTLQFVRLREAHAAADAAAAAREEMLAVVSHDLRNPLHAIILGTAMMDEVARDERGRRQVRIVHNAATRMQHMVDELLVAAQLDAREIELHYESCTPQRLLVETRELFQARAKEREIDLATRGTEVAIVGDHERLLEVLSNLVGNALKFTPPGGQIVITAEPCERAVRFAVADSGPGIAPEQVPHLFDRYWQGSKGNARTGLGLGLYICKRLVEAHHGAIGVDSTLGSGTTFWFDVPASDGSRAMT